MSDASSTLDDPNAFAEMDDAAHQRALAILLNVGTSIAQELKAPAADLTPTARAAAFDRVALAIRRTIILSRHITQRATVAPASPEARQVAARKQVIREVDDVIENRADKAEAEDLRVELLERLDSLEFGLDLTHRPPAELIQELCRDLGLADVPGFRRFKRRTPDDIAILCAQAAAAPGSGLPQWLAVAGSKAAENDRPPHPSLRGAQRRGNPEPHDPPLPTSGPNARVQAPTLTTRLLPPPTPRGRTTNQ